MAAGPERWDPREVDPPGWRQQGLYRSGNDAGLPNARRQESDLDMSLRQKFVPAAGLDKAQWERPFGRAARARMPAAVLVEASEGLMSLPAAPAAEAAVAWVPARSVHLAVVALVQTRKPKSKLKASQRPVSRLLSLSSYDPPSVLTPMHGLCHIAHCILERSIPLKIKEIARS